LLLIGLRDVDVRMDGVQGEGEEVEVPRSSPSSYHCVCLSVCLSEIYECLSRAVDIINMSQSRQTDRQTQRHQTDTNHSVLLYAYQNNDTKIC